MIALMANLKTMRGPVLNFSVWSNMSVMKLLTLILLHINRLKHLFNSIVFSEKCDNVLHWATVLKNTCVSVSLENLR